MNAQEFYEVAVEASNAKDNLNRSSSGYGGTLFAYSQESAQAGIEALDRLIRDRKEEIANAEYRLRQYERAVAAGGVEAYIEDAQKDRNQN